METRDNNGGFRFFFPPSALDGAPISGWTLVTQKPACLRGQTEWAELGANWWRLAQGQKARPAINLRFVGQPAARRNLLGEMFTRSRPGIDMLPRCVFFSKGEIRRQINLPSHAWPTRGFDIMMGSTSAYIPMMQARAAQGAWLVTTPKNGDPRRANLPPSEDSPATPTSPSKFSSALRFAPAVHPPP